MHIVCNLEILLFFLSRSAIFRKPSTIWLITQAYQLWDETTAIKENRQQNAENACTDKTRDG